MQHQLQLLRILLVHNHQTVVENAHDAVVGTVDPGNAVAFQSGFDNAVGAGIDHGRGTAGLTDDRGAD